MQGDVNATFSPQPDNPEMEMGDTKTPKVQPYSTTLTDYYT
jgi:hypothetical protein